MKCNLLSTPGYQGFVEINRQSSGENPVYAFRSDKMADLVYIVPRAALAARQTLAAGLGTAKEDLPFILIQPWDWPDACALTPTPFAKAASCIPTQLAGWRVVFALGGVQYIYHTDINGQIIQPIQTH
jgi:hypothetical protein